MTEEKQLPDRWVGEEVHLSHWGGDKSLGDQGTLEDVGDRGILVRIRQEPRFFPWHAVLEITPMSERRPRRATGVIR